MIDPAQVLKKNATTPPEATQEHLQSTLSSARSRFTVLFGMGRSGATHYGRQTNCSVFGVVLPSIHAKYAEFEASICIGDGEILTGEMPRKQLRLIQAWIELHRDELMTPNAANAFSMACRKLEPLLVTLLAPLSSPSESFPLLKRMPDVDCKLDKALLLDVPLIVDMEAS